MRTMAVRSTAALLEEGAAAFHQEPDPGLARDAMPGQLKLMESLLRNDPENPRLLAALSEGFVGYAFLFVEDAEPDRAKELYRRAAGYGLRLLGTNKTLRGLERLGPKEMTATLRQAGPDDVPGLYWTAYAWAAWANLDKNDPEALAAVPKAVRMMRRVLELEPGFQFGGPDTFFGVYYCARPRIAGGDPKKGDEHFRKAAARTKGRFLMAKTLRAQHCAVAVFDEDLFRSLNREVLDSSAGALEDARLANEVAKLKSKKLLESFDDLF